MSAPQALRPIRYRWVHHNVDGQTVTFNEVGIAEDGELINPNNYPEAQVRGGHRARLRNAAEKRKVAGTKAAATRKRRHDLKVDQIAARIVAGHRYGPNDHCASCGRTLSDQESIERGIGSECWGDLLRAIERYRAYVARAQKAEVIANTMLKNAGLQR